MTYVLVRVLQWNRTNSMHAGKANLYPTCVYSSRDKMLALPWWKWSSLISLPQLVQEMGPYQVLPLTDWALSSKHSQVSLGEWNPCCWAHANHPFSHHGHFVQESIERWQMWLWKRLNGIHTMDHLIYLIIKMLLYWSQCLMGIHMEHKHLHIFAYSRDLYILLPQSTLSPIFYSCFFPKSLAIQSNHWFQSINVQSHI